jgi:hypothetical protein
LRVHDGTYLIRLADKQVVNMHNKKKKTSEQP